MADQEQWLLMSNQSLTLTSTNKLELMDVLLLLLLFPSFPVIIRVVLQEQPKHFSSSAFIIHHKAGAPGMSALDVLHMLPAAAVAQAART